MKRAFYSSVAIWLPGGAALQILGKINGFSVPLMNLQTLVLLVFGGLSIILGLILFGRWVLNRNPQYFADLRAAGQVRAMPSPK
jgi:hypothetical protein